MSKNGNGNGALDNFQREARYNSTVTILKLMSKIIPKNTQKKIQHQEEFVLLFSGSNFLG